jgi:hypothetical protein
MQPPLPTHQEKGKVVGMEAGGGGGGGGLGQFDRMMYGEAGPVIGQINLT